MRTEVWGNVPPQRGHVLTTYWVMRPQPSYLWHELYESKNHGISNNPHQILSDMQPFIKFCVMILNQSSIIISCKLKLIKEPQMGALFELFGNWHGLSFVSFDYTWFLMSKFFVLYWWLICFFSLLLTQTLYQFNPTHITFALSNFRKLIEIFLQYRLSRINKKMHRFNTLRPR